MALPVAVRKFFGHALDFAQRGIQHDAAKVLKGFDGAAVLEVVEDGVGGTYRSVYTVKFEEAVFVLHCFKKKSKSGVATPKAHMAIVRTRLKAAQKYAMEDTKWQNEFVNMSRLKPVRATCLPTSACRVQTNSRSSPAW